MAGSPVPNNGETIALQQQVVRLQALLEASRQVHSTTCEEEVLDQVLHIIVRELEMDGAAFAGAELSYGNLHSSVRRYLLEDRSGQMMDELLVSVPENRELSLCETDFLEGLTLQAAVAMENARNQKRNIEFARVQQDLEAARTIQRSLLPQVLPNISGYSVGFRSDACYEVGGDYLDIVEQADGSLLIVVADVAGKGLASAILSSGFRAAFKAISATGIALDKLATQINQQHWAEGEEARRKYVTAIFLRLHPSSGEIEVVNAGHNPGLLVDPDGKVYQLYAAGVPLGLLSGMTYQSERLVLAPGMRMLLYTDGLTEVFRGDEEFGPERLTRAFSQCQSKKADDILDALWKEVFDFSEGSPQRDDMTALALCRRANGMEKAE